MIVGLVGIRGPIDVKQTQFGGDFRLVQVLVDGGRVVDGRVGDLQPHFGVSLVRLRVDVSHQRRVLVEALDAAFAQILDEFGSALLLRPEDVTPPEFQRRGADGLDGGSDRVGVVGRRQEDLDTTLVMIFRLFYLVRGRGGGRSGGRGIK